jgi:hypothetical protein
MGFGSEKKRLKTYYIAAYGSRKDGNKNILDPHFKIVMVDLDGSKSNKNDEKEVTGLLVGLSHGEYEWPKDSGKKIKKIIVTLFDDNALFKIDMPMNSNMIRSVMNTIIGTETFDEMRLSLFATKDGFANMYVSDNSGKATDRVKKKFDYKTKLAPMIKEVDDPQNEGKKMKIYHEVNRLLWDEWLKVESIANAYAKEKGYLKLVEEATKASPSSSTEHLDNQQRSAVEEFIPDDFEPSNNGQPPIPDFAYQNNNSAADDLPF